LSYPPWVCLIPRCNKCSNTHSQHLMHGMLSCKPYWRPVLN